MIIHPTREESIGRNLILGKYISDLIPVDPSVAISLGSGNGCLSGGLELLSLPDHWGNYRPFHG